jgi:ABC-type nitrate/sulfonate/bicarbonate transport system permease component
MAEDNAPTLFGAAVSEGGAIASQIAQAENEIYLTSTARRSWTGRQGWFGRGDKLRLVSALAILAVIGVWYLVTALHMVSPVVLPTPLAVLQDFQLGWTQGFASKTLFADIEISFVRVAEAFVLAVVIGVPIGLIMAQSDVIFHIIDPFIEFLRPVPPLAYIPLLVVWMGIGEAPKVMLIFLGTAPVMIISTIAGVRNTPIQRIRVAQCLGANRFQQFIYTIFPSSLPEIFTGMRIGIGGAWSCLVAAEMIAADIGLGWLVQYAGEQIQVGYIFVGIIIIGILGYGMELVIRLLERGIVPWKGHA